MKKTLKFTIATVLFLLVAGAGVLYYFMNVKEYDVADEKVEEITESDYNVDLPDLDSAVPSEDGSSKDSEGTATEDTKAGDDTNGNSGNEDPSVNASGAASASSSNAASKDTSSKEGSKSSASTSASKNSEGKKEEGASNNGGKKTVVTAEIIKAAYRPSFESLQAQANAKIDALVNTAYSEYQAKKQSGESVSITYFYQKYTSAGKTLESNTNETFNYIYGALVKDLEARGFSESEASEFKTQYENAKSARESALIEKAKSAL